MIRDQIVKVATSFVGKEEIKGNLGFKDEKFQQYMETMGWDVGQAWCAYFTELVWKLAYSSFDSTIISRVDELFSAGAVATWNNFSRSDFKTADRPEPGDVVIWQNLKNGKPHWTGHAGIVVEVNDDIYKTVEGNSNSEGGREGYKVVLKERNFDQFGFILKGFIKPIEV